MRTATSRFLVLSLGLFISIFLAGCDLFGSAAPTATPVVPTTAPSAEVIAVTSPAFACPDTTGCNSPAADGERIFAGGEARTESGGAANLRTSTAIFRLEENATLRFKAISNALEQLVLDAGRLFVSHDGSGRVEIT